MAIKRIAYPRPKAVNDIAAVEAAVAAITDILEAEGKVIPEAVKVVRDKVKPLSLSGGTRTLPTLGP